MKRWLNRLFWGICGLMLRMRYRLKISGAEKLQDLKGATLVLPNHPALVDPPLVSSRIRLHKPLRPLVNSATYRTPIFRPLMSLVDAFEVPDLSAHSRDAHSQVLDMIDSVVDRLHAGDCMLIYPSGRLQRGNVEVVGAARAVHEIVAKSPDVNIVLIRTRGLWGSMFSCAETNSPPNLSARVKSALGWVFASVFFFLPRRDVSMHIEVLKPEDMPTDSRESFNAFLEDWYNKDGAQEPKFVRYHHLFGPSHGEFGKSLPSSSTDIREISDKTKTQVNELLQSHLKRQLSGDELQADTTLESIGLDSLDRMDVALKIEQQFSFRSNVVTETVGGLWALAAGQLSDDANEKVAAPKAWENYPKIDDTPTLLADTIGAAFVSRALKQLNRVAVADSISGVLNYRRLLVACELMSRRFAKLEEAHVGVMLPASVAADIVFFALQMAGKIPVMMNWTTGPSNLAHGAEVTETRHIITSRKMIDRMNIEVKGAEYIFLEDIRKGIGKFESLLVLCRTYLAGSSFKRHLARQSPEDTAVFLFTSGSESLPKTVPLTHRNLLTNVVDGLEVLKATNNDTLLGFLPPFHSFGMTGNLILPHLTGIRCIRYADPTDSRGLVKTIETYKPTLVFTTPTFLGYILAACSGDELSSLKTIVTGAEKCPEHIFESCKQKAPNATILEGYGITECSPVVAGNTPGGVKPGTIGKPVKSVDVRIIDVDTEQEVAADQTGMLLVAGPSIFSGYYKHEGPDPFVVQDERRWYKTGDLVSIDKEGYLHFQGRLKRFIKAGGEMISLPALEEPFVAKFPPDEKGPTVAVEGVETDEGRHIVLFTTHDITLREASEILLAAGMRGVMRLDEVRNVEKIPVLGTGKTDYKSLRQMLSESPSKT